MYSHYISSFDFFPQCNVITVVPIVNMNDFPGLKPELILKKRVVKAMTDEGEQNHA